VLAGRGGVPDSSGWPVAEDLTGYYREHWPAKPLAVPLEEDPGVVLANLYGAEDAGADVVVSLCRVGRRVPRAKVRVEVRLLDSEDPDDNPNIAFVLDDLARSIATWRDQGKRVVVHCVQAERRTPAVAAAYLAHHLGTTGAEAWERVARQLPTARRNRVFEQALKSRWPGGQRAST